jgi:glycine dehydrogenase subunit 1
LAERLGKVPGVKVLGQAWFNEFTVILPRDASEVVDELAAKGVLGGVPLGRLYPHRPELRHALLVTATETNTADDIAVFAETLEGVLA